MEINMPNLFILFAILSFSSIASARSFTFVTDRPELVPVEWNYREVASHRNFPGCQGWDFLQGTGWFPSTWYTDYTPVLEQGAYTVETKHSSLRAKYCAAKMDPYNALRMELDNSEGVNTPLHGFVAIVPDGMSNDVTVECSIDLQSEVADLLVCGKAHVLQTNEPVVVRVVLVEGLPQ